MTAKKPIKAGVKFWKIALVFIAWASLGGAVYMTAFPSTPVIPEVAAAYVMVFGMVGVSLMFDPRVKFRGLIYWWSLAYAVFLTFWLALTKRIMGWLSGAPEGIASTLRITWDVWPFVVVIGSLIWFLCSTSIKAEEAKR